MCDFGLGRTLDTMYDKEKLTKVGTPLYLSP
jgi:hypothetical protein